MRIEHRPVLSICALVGLLVLVSLGTWQLQRLEWKRQLIAKSEARISQSPAPLKEVLAILATGQDQEYRPVSVTGIYRHEGEQRVFGTFGGKPGYYLFTPMEITIADTQYIYVNRGFVPQKIWQNAISDNAISDIARPSDEVSINGLYRGPEMRRGLANLLAPDNQLEESLWFERRPDLMAQDSNINAHAGYLDLISDVDAGRWPKSGTTRLDFSNRHMEYALTWFGLAVTLVGVWGAFSIKKN